MSKVFLLEQNLTRSRSNNNTNKSTKKNKHVVIAGATGLAGRATVLHYWQQGWKVTALSRRIPDYHSLPAHASMIRSKKTYNHVQIDLLDEETCMTKLKDACENATHAVYCAAIALNNVFGVEEAEKVKNQNVQMLINFLNALEAGSSQLKHISCLHGTGYYGSYVRINPIKFPSLETRPPVEGNTIFYMAQEEILRKRQPASTWDYTTWRPPLLVGFGVGSALNIINAMAVHAVMLREKGLPLTYPGPEITAVQECLDCRLLAKAFEWAGNNTNKTKQKTYNVTNGDVFLWPNLWEALAEVYDMKMADPLVKRERLRVTMVNEDREKEWKDIVQKYNLLDLKLSEFVGYGFEFTDGSLRANTMGIPTESFAKYKYPNKGLLIAGHMSDSIEIRLDGFDGYIRTKQALVEIFRTMQRDRYIPY